MPIPILPAAPLVDGDLSEYAAVAPVALDEVAWGHADGPPDVSGQARMAVSGTDLVVAVEVRDDVYVPPSGIAGDHVEVWIADPALDRESAWQSGEESVGASDPSSGEAAHALAERAGRFQAAHPRALQVIAGSSGLFDAKLHPIAGAAAIRQVPGGWQAELRIPLTDLPRLSTLSLGRLDVRVDVVDADGNAAQDALVNATGRRDRFPEWTLTSAARLGDDPWADGQLGPVTWVRTGDEWKPVQPDWARAEAPGAMFESVVGFRPASLPVVATLAAPSPFRTVDGVPEWLVGGAWEEAPGQIQSTVPDADAEYVVFYDEAPEFGGPDAHAWGNHNCAAATDPTWTVVHWDSRGPEVLDSWSYSGCDTPAELEDLTCTAKGLAVVCGGPRKLSVPFDLRTRRFVVPRGLADPVR